eukprot:scaffold71849_cov75-Phaeocystis_antarctica.AAC.4
MSTYSFHPSGSGAAVALCVAEAGDVLAKPIKAAGGGGRTPLSGPADDVPSKAAFCRPNLRSPRAALDGEAAVSESASRAAVAGLHETPTAGLPAESRRPRRARAGGDMPPHPPRRSRQSRPAAPQGVRNADAKLRWAGPRARSGARLLLPTELG